MFMHVVTESATVRTTFDTNAEGRNVTQQPQQQHNVQTGNQSMTSDSGNLQKWLVDSDDYSDDLDDLNIEGEDSTLQHVPIEEWGCSLSD